MRRHFTWMPILLILAAGLQTEASAATLHVDTFGTSSTLSWGGGASGGVTTEVVPTGGPAGVGDGYLEVAQPNEFNMAVRTQAPTWTGNFASIGAEQISVDLRSAPGSDPLAIRLVLFGPNPGGDSNRWVSNAAILLPDDGVWRSATFPLVESEFARLGSGSFSQLMAGVVRVMFRHDPDEPTFGGTSVTGTLGLDNIALEVAPPLVLAGDYNDDGVVDAADYLAWRNNVGSAAGTLPNDVDGGPIGGAQYASWKTHFGEASDPGLGTASQQVPEPAFCACVGTLLAMLIARRRRPR